MDTLIWLVSVCLVWLTILHGCYSKNPDECPKLKYCQCHKHKMYCNAGSIPRAPPSIVEVHLTNIQLGNVTRAMARNLTYCKMTSLYLKDNNISHISSDAFQDLSHLRLLDWQQDDLPIVDIEALLGHVTSDLETIRLYADNVHHAAMNASVFQNITKLNSLTIRLKGLATFDVSAFSTMIHLEKLDFSYNLLNTIIFRHPIASIKSFNLAGNNFEHVPDLCRVDRPALTPRLEMLNLEHNVIRQLSVSSLICLQNLQKLTLSRNRFEVLQDNVFSNIPKLKILHLSDMLYLRHIERHAFNSTSLYKVYFANNPALTRNNFNPTTNLFAHTPNLGFLELSSTKLDIHVSDLKAFLLSLKNIESLILQGIHMKVLPDGVFSQLKKLKHLVLSGNYFSGWKDTVFANATHIKSIFFDGCKIATINESSFPLEFRLNVEEIDLANNNFQCTCDLLWFRNWMKAVIANNSIKFSQYPHRYVCRNPNAKQLPLKDFNPTVKSCTFVSPYVIILATVLPIIAVIVIMGLAIYRFRWYLLYWLSLLRQKHHKQHDPHRTFQYDAFVSYSNPDYDWVEKELLDYLEAKGSKLCEHTRDFLAGKLIVDNVLDAMDTSRKTILVISNDYMKSDWCKFELQMAFNGSLKNEFELVVILLEPIKVRQMTSTLRALMTSTTYMEWHGDGVARTLFQIRLENLVRK